MPPPPTSGSTPWGVLLKPVARPGLSPAPPAAAAVAPPAELTSLADLVEAPTPGPELDSRLANSKPAVRGNQQATLGKFLVRKERQVSFFL